MASERFTIPHGLEAAIARSRNTRPTPPLDPEREKLVERLQNPLGRLMTADCLAAAAQLRADAAEIARLNAGCAPTQSGGSNV